ncbi:nitrate- and nitrite sensing domain-containing protein [Streptomyces sp. NRRL S-340]|uniref:sensor histidine kinase n=1 Tax=Streptomyces sp. NRRL S-340 TaxID=1463901 RepID=UPI00055D9252|nr:nitrate- and nitrite sensing domain-containing protein [Streptomyces sp. NRRL S-340]
MQKKRPRRTGKQTATAKGPERTTGTPSAVPPATAVGKGRPTHVRNRLVVSVAVVAAVVAGAGAPGVIDASGRLSDSQHLVTLAGQTQDALALAHSLADERDEVTSYVAAGRPRSKAPSEQRSTRVDRQVDELRADPGTPAWLRTDLDGIAAVRRSALTGQSSALQAHQAYSATIAELHRLAGQLAERTPPRAGSGAHALAELDTAVQQAAAARGLLLAALNVPYTTRTVYDPVTGVPAETTNSSKAGTKLRDALSAAAQQARVRSDAALAAFRETAPEAARDSYDSTVTGPEVNSATAYLAKLTDQPTLSDSDLATSAKKADTALTARIDLMRGAESSLYDHRTKDLAKLRDDDVTALELRIALLGALVLLAVGIATALARTLTRPLAVLRLGSARLAGAEDLAAEEPIRFTGRNDEYAQVVRSVNALHTQAAALAERVATLEADRKHLVGQRQKMADAREELRAELADATARLDRMRAGIGSTFVNLALRTLGLVERQLTVIESLEEREQDPDRLATLFKLDHFATVMRRHSENLLVLAGTEHVQQHAGPVPLVDVVRAAVSEIERYERVRIAALPPHAHVAGFAADDLSHLLAELMENATSFSPPDRPVEVSGWLLENGEIMLSVQDEGIGVDGERLTRLNARLADPGPDAAYHQDGEEDAKDLGLGLYVVARLGHRHGVRVQLREQKQGGTAAVVVVPQPLLAPAPASAVPAAGPGEGGTGTFSLPGADAEANSNVLHARAQDGGADPLVALAEQAVRESEAAEGTQETTPQESPSETTMELLLPTPAPDRDAPAGPAGDRGAAGEPDRDTAADPAADRGAVEEPARDRDTAAPHETARRHPDPAAPAPQDASASGTASPSGAASAAETAPWPGLAPASGTTSGTGTVSAPGGSSLPGGSAASGTAAPWPGAAPATEAASQQAPAPAGRPAPAPAPEPAPWPGAAPAPAPTPDAAPAPGAAGDEEPDPDGAEHARASEETLTAKGLPKRTPRITTPAQAPRQRTGSVDAEALRRRLGGFRRGAQAGYRDVEAEIADQTAQNRRPTPATRTQAEQSTGGTVEEASS